MNEQRTGGTSEDGDTATWTSETLPLHVRRELLERELRKLGFRKAGQHQGGSAQQQQQPHGASPSHPSAGGDGDHAD